MALIIKKECIDIKDGTCVEVCPVDCIYEGPRMFYIHQDECIECGLCESVCPVDAIRYDDEVEAEDQIYLQINREYFDLTGIGSPGGASTVGAGTRDHPIVAQAPKNTLKPE
ncbi:MAG: ferredoxin [Pseudomonadota bacterium]